MKTLKVTFENDVQVNFDKLDDKNFFNIQSIKKIELIDYDEKNKSPMYEIISTNDLIGLSFKEFVFDKTDLLKCINKLMPVRNKIIINLL